MKEIEDGKDLPETDDKKEARGEGAAGEIPSGSRPEQSTDLRPVPAESDDASSEELGLLPEARKIPDPAEAICQESEPVNGPEHEREAIDLPTKPVSEMSSAEKGEFGEKLTAEAMENEGFEPVGSHEKPQGIDSVWMKDGEVILIETKFRSDGKVGENQLKATHDGQQSSMDWTFMRENESQPSRLAEACGDRIDEVLGKMIENGYATRVAVVDGEGSLSFRDIDTQPKGWVAGHEDLGDDRQVRLGKESHESSSGERRTRSYFH